MAVYRVVSGFIELEAANVPPGGGGGDPGKPPGIWGPTDPRPNPPIAFPPGWVGGVPPGGWPPPGGGGDKPPGKPPSIWPGGPGIDWPQHPIYLPPGSPGGPGGPGAPPGSPPVLPQLPPELGPPPSPPSGPPDLASPGYWAWVQSHPGVWTMGFVQTAVITDEDHVPKPPAEGLAGTWIVAYDDVARRAVDAWVPTAGTAATK